MLSLADIRHVSYDPYPAFDLQIDIRRKAKDLSHLAVNQTEQVSRRKLEREMKEVVFLAWARGLSYKEIEAIYCVSSSAIVNSYNALGVNPHSPESIKRAVLSLAAEYPKEVALALRCRFFEY